MSNYAQYKRDFIKGLIDSGSHSYKESAFYGNNLVPEHVLQRWVDKFYKAARPVELPHNRRLINHFSLGADPEFSLFNKGDYVHASALNLQAGRCFGADNNGRLVEIRPAPSRFALEVVASMLSELRFFAAYYPATLQYHWVCSPYNGADGIGGHVHFGRKRLDRRILEVAALDNVMALMVAAELFPYKDVRNRIHARGHYGQFGDTRTQVHGFEYRTFPSWLATPWVAYLALVLSKLVVANKDCKLVPWDRISTAMWESPSKLTQQDARKWIRNLLAANKGLDDDALFAYLALDVWGLPSASIVQSNKDFKGAWGLQMLPNAMPPIATLPKLLPPSIKPSWEVCGEVFQHLCYGHPLQGVGQLRPTWQFTETPKGFRSLQELGTMHAPGLGELCWDVVYSTEFPKMAVAVEEAKSGPLKISCAMADLIGKTRIAQLRSLIGIYISASNDGHWIIIPTHMLQPGEFHRTKRVIAKSGLTPFTTLTLASKFDLQAWMAKPKEAMPRSRSIELFPAKEPG